MIPCCTATLLSVCSRQPAAVQLDLSVEFYGLYSCTAVQPYGAEMNQAVLYSSFDTTRIQRELQQCLLPPLDTTAGWSCLNKTAAMRRRAAGRDE